MGGVGRDGRMEGGCLGATAIFLPSPAAPLPPRRYGETETLGQHGGWGQEVDLCHQLPGDI